MASGLPALPGQGRRADGPARRSVLALRTVAALRVGELASAGVAELQRVRRAALLVPQPQKRLMWRLRKANIGTLNEW